MSRAFGPNLGPSGNHTDVIVSRYSTPPKNQISASCWVYWNAVTVQFNNLFGCVNSSNNSNWLLFIANNATILGFQRTFSSQQFAAWTIVPPQKVWFHLLVTYDASSVANNPIIYVNGARVIVTTATAPIGTPVNDATNIRVGNYPNLFNTNNTWDGMVAHAAYWNGILLSDSDAIALGSGVNPTFIRPDSLSTYMPLDGISSPENDLVLGNISSITGTLLGTSDPPAQSLSGIYGITSEVGIISTLRTRRTLSDLGTATGRRQVRAA